MELVFSRWSLSSSRSNSADKSDYDPCDRAVRAQENILWTSIIVGNYVHFDHVPHGGYSQDKDLGYVIDFCWRIKILK